jgi:hypothetical protein
MQLPLFLQSPSLLQLSLFLQLADFKENQGPTVQQFSQVSSIEIYFFKTTHKSYQTEKSLKRKDVKFVVNITKRSHGIKVKLHFPLDRLWK